MCIWTIHIAWLHYIVSCFILWMKTGATPPKCNMIPLSRKPCKCKFRDCSTLIVCHMHATTCTHPLIYTFRFSMPFKITTFQHFRNAASPHVTAGRWARRRFPRISGAWRVVCRRAASCAESCSALRWWLWAVPWTSCISFAFEENQWGDYCIVMIVLHVFYMSLIGYSLGSICLQQQPWISCHLRGVSEVMLLKFGNFPWPPGLMECRLYLVIGFLVLQRFISSAWWTLGWSFDLTKRMVVFTLFFTGVQSHSIVSRPGTCGLLNHSSWRFQPNLCV